MVNSFGQELILAYVNIFIFMATFLHNNIDGRICRWGFYLTANLVLGNTCFHDALRMFYIEIHNRVSRLCADIAFRHNHNRPMFTAAQGLAMARYGCDLIKWLDGTGVTGFPNGLLNEPVHRCVGFHN